jgi:3-oxoacyl-[acyl-carrier-protein] synthase II
LEESDDARVRFLQQFSKGRPMTRDAREVVVTGLGLVLPNCDTPEAFWAHVSKGESQLRMYPNPANPSRALAMGRLDFDPAHYLASIPEEQRKKYPREVQVYLASVFLALKNAKLDLQKKDPERVCLFDGVARPMFEFWYESVRREEGRTALESYTRTHAVYGLPGQPAGIAASLLRVQGQVLTIPAACTSGAVAAGLGYREIRSGDADVAIVGAHETALIPPLFALYESAGVLNLEAKEPTRAISVFGQHTTSAPGEGAVSFVLEPRSAAEQRDARIMGVIKGFKHGNIGSHPTGVDSTGERPAALIRSLLKSAGYTPGDVDFVMGHGNGVQASDDSEVNCMKLVFGKRAREVPLLSNKPIYGHVLGGASAVNMAAALMMVQNDYIIPTINMDTALADTDVWHQPDVGKTHPCKLGIVTSYGIGGHCTAVLIGKYEV